MNPTPRHHLLFLAAFVCGGVGIGSLAAAETQTVASFKRTVTKTIGYDYLLSLPTGYDAAAEKKWPVILFLHGSGERGTDPWLVAKHGPPKLIRGDGPAAKPVSVAPGATPPSPAPTETAEARTQREQAAAMLRENFIVISPQCPNGPWWDDEAVLALLDDVMAQHKTDASRVYLTGLSMGGYGTWSIALKNPQRFAAIVAICGGGQYADLLRLTREKKAALLTLGVRVFHGAKDPTVPLEESERMVAALKKIGVTDLQFTVYPEAKHDSWTETYNKPELYAWLLKHQR
jgi:predicted peptidase